MQPSVHFFDFTDEVNPNNHPDRFNVLWHVDAARDPQQKPGSEKKWGGVLEGDLVVFPSLLSGAGDFEAVRFVGPKTTHLSEGGNEEDVLPLLTAGIEYPEFPTLIATMAEEQGTNLRELYENPFNAILQSQPPKLKLIDLFSRDEEAYKEYWDDVPIARRRRPPSDSPWKFSLGSLVWIKTLNGKSLAGEAVAEKQTGEEL